MAALIRAASVGATSRSTIGSGWGAAGSAPAVAAARKAGASEALAGRQEAVARSMAAQASSRPRQLSALRKALKEKEMRTAKVVPVASSSAALAFDS